MNNQDKTSEEITPKLPLWSYQLQQDSKLAVKTRKDLEIHLITRALKDEGFKQDLVAYPKGAIEKELGVKLPDELEIQVLEETENTLYMVLPCNPYEGMSEAEMQSTLGMTYEDVAQWVLQQQRNSLLDEANTVVLVVRAWRDEIFKQKLFQSPVAVIEEELGIKIQEGIQIKTFLENCNFIYIVIPSILDSLGDSEYLFDSEILEVNKIMIVGSGGGGGANYIPKTSQFDNRTWGCYVNTPSMCVG